jgi:hypothetical protein
MVFYLGKENSCVFIIDRIKKELPPPSIGFHFVDELMPSFGSLEQTVNAPSICMRIMMGFGRQMTIGVSRFYVQFFGHS